MPISAVEPLLDIHGLEAGYGKIAVLHGVDMTIGVGEVVTLLGPNGAGKTTLLSGGQQQMLAVAQGLVRQPKLLMLDEPSAGLSPVLVDRVLAVVTKLQKTGTAVLLVEQLIEKALAVADRVYALAQGKIVLQASTDEADLPRHLEQAYFGSEAA